jgi:hypothetical protein
MGGVPMTAAARRRRQLAEAMRRYRQRQAKDRWIFEAEASWTQMTDLLSSAGLLDEWDSHDKEKVRAAWQQFVDRAFERY